MAAILAIWVSGPLLAVAQQSPAPPVGRGEAAGSEATAEDTIRYEIAFPNAVHHEAQVTVRYAGLAGGTLEMRMSRSSPGRYALHEFAKNVYSVQATDDGGRPLPIAHPNPHEWDIQHRGGGVTVTYTLFADHADGTYSGVDSTHAHLNLPATFMYARGLDAKPIRVTFHLPENHHWKVATQLAPTGDPSSYTAPDLQYFMDSPTELSDYDLRTWTVQARGKQYTMRLAIHHKASAADVDAFTEMARKIVNEEAAIYGGVADFDYGTYTFIADYLPWDFGDGMEHRNSTFMSSSFDLAGNAGRLIGTVSHEFFHHWNMERIRSRGIEPFDFARANMSGELWFGEGFTQYYGNLALCRAGIWSQEQYIRGLAGSLHWVIYGGGRRFHSPVGMSMEAPFVDAATSIDANNFGNTFISYYTWGSAVALGLDLTLRSRYHKTLDDYMRAMWENYGSLQNGTTPQKPYTLDDLRTTLGTLTGDQAFADDFFAHYISGRDVVDYKALLANAGVLLRPAHPDAATLGDPVLREQNGGLYVRSSTDIGTPLYQAGVDDGDRIVSLDGQSITTAKSLADVVGRHKPGEKVTLVYEQRGERKTTPITFAADDALESVPYEVAGMEVTAAMRQFRAAWLGSKAN